VFPQNRMPGSLVLLVFFANGLAASTRRDGSGFALAIAGPQWVFAYATALTASKGRLICCTVRGSTTLVPEERLEMGRRQFGLQAA
jgi:hypothetical protein